MARAQDPSSTPDLKIQVADEQVWELIALPKALVTMLFDDIAKLSELHFSRPANPRAMRERTECVIASALCLSQVATELLAQPEAADRDCAAPKRPSPVPVWYRRTGGYSALEPIEQAAAAIAYKLWKARHPAAARRHDLEDYVAFRQNIHRDRKPQPLTSSP